ncbi:hypothetical protein [Natronosalvus vescus]|uniref:hypothetical protein n=1 Tax=Natronosalvus vescus TaxID=2953881 RepID=UPI0020904510|nr:hypothetical protein [Natronosalvus vescus]
MSVTHPADDTSKSDVDAATADTFPIDRARAAEHQPETVAAADSQHQRPHADTVALPIRIERLHLETRIAALERTLRDQRRRNQALIDQYEYILEAVTETATDAGTGDDAETAVPAADAECTNTTAAFADAAAPDETDTTATDRTESASPGLLARLRSMLK